MLPVDDLVPLPVVREVDEIVVGELQRGRVAFYVVTAVHQPHLTNICYSEPEPMGPSVRARWPTNLPLCVAMLLACAVALPARAVRAQIPSPEAHFGFEMGAEGRLAAMDAIERYFDLV
ncbi:MAG TPA: hypothetical protein VFM23_04145, partial [Gemmatimonadales bacterium]|nr:hypothetical protein [Gemmatimonadales bacterium]